MKEKILITSALPYANGPLHFGHIAGAYLPADCYARYERMMNRDVLYICGSDEYGIAIALSAELAGRTPKEHVDIFHSINRDLFTHMNMSFDHYSRTTWEGHDEAVHQYFKDLLANGYIEEMVTDQLYSEADNKFLADRYVVGTCPKCGFENARGDECPRCGSSYDSTDLINPRSKLTNNPLTHKATKHWFLMLDKFKDRLIAWLETKDWKPNVVNFIKGYINDLRPRAITRDSNWGIKIPLPDTEGKVLYVWFDAPIGYISATKEWAIQAGNPERWKDYWLDPKTKLVNFVGKDNIPFHAAIFPAMTMGQNTPYKLVDELPANEFYNFEGKKFSKSDGWFIDLEDFFKRYSPDQIRYAIAANAPETADSEFTWKDFQLRCNTDLLGKYGNLVNRVLVFAKNQCEGKVPPLKNLEPIDEEFLATIKRLVDEASQSFESFKVRRASQIVMELAAAGNVYFDAKKPWSAAKQPETRGSMETTIAACLECLKALAIISSPIIPDSAQKVWNQLGFTTTLSNWQKTVDTQLEAGHKLGEPKILFQKVEDSQIAEEVAKLNNQANVCGSTTTEVVKMEYAPLKPLIDIEEFRKMDLRVGRVISAMPVPKSKKLLKLEVDLGFEKRTVVSGISQHYSADELVGQNIILVANLKPAVLMGIESHGMILCGHGGEALEIVSVDEISPGGEVN